MSRKKSSIKKETLEVFVNKKGYDLVEKTESGFKGVSRASEVTGLSRPTIYAILEAFPEPPNKTIPKYVEEWKQTEGYQFFRDHVKGKVSKSAYNSFLNFGLDCWKLLHKKDPVSWTLEDYKKLWNLPAFYDEYFLERGKEQISYNNACKVRKWINVMAQNPESPARAEWVARGSPLFSTKKLKRPKGMYKGRFLEEPEEISLIKATENHTFLLWLRLAKESFGRASSLEFMTPADINFRQSIIKMYEPKTDDYIPRLFHASTLKLLDRFIHDYNIKRSQKLFPAYEWTRKQLKDTAERGGVSKITDDRVATHIMKHTGVTQGALHGLSMEELSEQSGTDPSTLRDFYIGGVQRKLRHSILGEPKEVREEWHEWIGRLDGIYQKQYEELEVDPSHRVGFGNGNSLGRNGGHFKTKLEQEGA